MKFYLGSPNPAWLKRTTVPLFVSHTRLGPYKRLPKAAGAWSLDSGGFTQLNTNGQWSVTADEYADAVMKYQEGIGGLDWASPQDWMCEPWIIEKTGKSVAAHLELTVASYLELKTLAPDAPFIPVLQGWEMDDYLKCAELYESAGVRLADCPTVGVGSVCRRQSTDDIGTIMANLSELGLNLHGFGVKITGLKKYAKYLTSADSMAWSYAARVRPIRLPGCEHDKCSYCMTWALQWRESALAAAETTTEWSG